MTHCSGHLYIAFATKQVFIEAVLVLTPYCLATANQMRRLGEAPHGSRVNR